MFKTVCRATWHRALVATFPSQDPRTLLGVTEDPEGLCISSLYLFLSLCGLYILIIIILKVNVVAFKSIYLKIKLKKKPVQFNMCVCVCLLFTRKQASCVLRGSGLIGVIFSSAASRSLRSEVGICPKQRGVSLRRRASEPAACLTTASTPPCQYRRDLEGE